VITTGTTGEFFVVGAVTKPGAAPLQGARPTTVMQALASVGGLTPVAKESEARLIRTVGNTRSVIPLQLKDIQDGKIPDPLVQADDIILIPTSAMKSLFRINNAAIIVSVAVAAATLFR
jgi:polysaccharide export outer membrane protein